jgi:hypothetical protein
MSRSTQSSKPDPGVPERQHTRQDGWSERKTIGAVAAAAVALVLIAALVGCQGSDEAPTAEEVSTGFLEAYSAFDVEQARTYLAPGARIASMTAQDDLRLLISYLEATGYEQILDSCEGVGDRPDSASGNIRCTFDFHGLRSDEVGRGPFGGSSFDLFVRDGKIVEARQDWETEKFSPQMWEPFAGWVTTAHPKDAAVMYTDKTHSNVRLTEESIRLWERDTREYVKEVGRNT